MKIPGFNTVTRRELIEGIAKSSLAASVAALPVAKAATPSQLHGTEAFTGQGDIAAQMVEGIHNFLLKQTEASVGDRETLWHRDYSSRARYETSVAPNRKRFAKVIGLIDERHPDTKPIIEEFVGEDPVVAVGDGFKIYRVRWPVLHGVDGEGLLLQPDREALAFVIALGDADWSPEKLASLAP